MNLLPHDVIGSILGHVVAQNGFLPAIVYTRNLSFTSRVLKERINSHIVVCSFLNALKAKFGESCEYHAACLNTIGARRWLWSHIQQNGDFESYQIFQDIYNIWKKILLNVRNAGIDSINFTEFKPKGHSQTCQGFRLNNHAHIETPFGVFTFGISEDNQFHRTLIALMRSLNCTFEYMVDAPYAPFDEQISEIDIPSGSVYKDEIIFKPVTREELKTRIGSNSLFSNFYYELCSYYKISEVNGRAVPDYKKDEIRKVELICRIWELLELNHQGIDPITKRPK